MRQVKRLLDKAEQETSVKVCLGGFDAGHSLCWQAS
jgi:hypothetical protein